MNYNIVEKHSRTQNINKLKFLIHYTNIRSNIIHALRYMIHSTFRELGLAYCLRQAIGIHCVILVDL